MAWYDGSGDVNKAPEAMDIWFAFYNKEISLEQLRAQLKDIGWTDEEIEDGLDAQD